MPKVHIVENCAAPVESAFDYVDDYRNTIKYLSGMTRYEPVGDKVHGLGAVFDGTMELGPFTLTSRVEYVGYEKNTLLASRSISGVETAFTYRFTALDEKTSCVDLLIEFRLPGGMASRAAEKVAAPFVKIVAKEIATNLSEQIAAHHVAGNAVS